MVHKGISVASDAITRATGQNRQIPDLGRKDNRPDCKMPQLPRYEYTGPVDCTIPPNRHVLKGKSVIITGGMSIILRFQ